MATIVLTGSAGGIGIATRARLEKDGYRVIGVDVRDAEVIADLSTPAGRLAMIEGVTRAADDRAVDGVIAGAGTMDDELAIPVNYFGAVATLEGLRPLLARGTDPAAVAISSNSTIVMPSASIPAARSTRASRATRNRAKALAPTGYAVAYALSKLALARWVRRNAPTDAWIGAGIRLNAIAPGVIETPMTDGTLDFIMSLGDAFPVPMKRPGRPEEIAATLAFLCSPDASLINGALLFVDGGTEAAVRADDWPTALG